MRQNIAYFDARGAGGITTRITADTNLVQDGISEKVGLTLTALATFVTAYIIGFVKYWKLTLILTSTIVAIVVTMGALGQMIVKYQKKSLAAYAEGGTVAEEVLSSIRNAVAFGTQDKLATEYAKHLTEAEKSGFKMKGKKFPQATIGYIDGKVHRICHLECTLEPDILLGCRVTRGVTRYFSAD